ncbi:MAG: hypothetical protein HKP61_16950 [Dactylosporangium sp.]|nr:hypothetical protein [Dactylosporangium sp.]NNJ62596.1 hypothetical protein [Dactylosporangium sp.]
MSLALPGLVGGGVGLASTGSAAAASYIGTVVTALAAPAIDRWFKRKEVVAQEARVAAMAHSQITGADRGAMSRAYATIAVAFQRLDEIDGQMRRCSEALEHSQTRLATTLGGGNAVAAEVHRTFGHNATARKRLGDAHAALEKATVALHRFHPTVA